MSRQLSDKNIKISVSSEDFVIEANPRMISELVYNLCENAIKYNKDGGSIDIRIYRRGEDKIFEIKDSGIGIDEKYHERIFERFFRVDKSHSKKTGGTGLGLSIVKHIAQYHNAALEVESEVGIGTTIRIVF